MWHLHHRYKLDSVEAVANQTSWNGLAIYEMKEYTYVCQDCGDVCLQHMARLVA